MKIQRFPTIAAFKEHFAELNLDINLHNLEQQVGPGKGRLAVVTEGETILTLLVEMHPNVIVTVLTCVGNFAPSLPVDIFEDYVKEYNSGLLVVDMPAWCEVAGGNRLSTVYRSPKASLGVIPMKIDIPVGSNLKKRLRNIRNSTEPYNYQIQLVGFSANEIEKNHVHLAAMNYEVARYQYEVN